MAPHPFWPYLHKMLDFKSAVPTNVQTEGRFIMLLTNLKT